MKKYLATIILSLAVATTAEASLIRQAALQVVKPGVRHACKMSGPQLRRELKELTPLVEAEIATAKELAARVALAEQVTQARIKNLNAIGSRAQALNGRAKTFQNRYSQLSENLYKKWWDYRRQFTGAPFFFTRLAGAMLATPIFILRLTDY